MPRRASNRATLIIAATTAFACASSNEPVPGDGTIDGSFGGHAFDHVGASWRIGHPDDPARTIVIYILDAEVACHELATPGWDERVGEGVQSLEIKLVGTMPSEFPVSTTATPAQGEADVNYTLTSASAPAETSASGGMVTLDDASDARAVGSFDLMFAGGDRLHGSFDAAPCSEGHEP